MNSGLFALAPVIILSLLYFAVIAAIIIMIVVWVNKFLNLRREQNDLLREIIKKLDNK